jgi:hypothetical protein
MNRFSVNGILKPTDNLLITDQYNGHFLKVSYIQEIAKKSVYSKDRVDVADKGNFRFFLPKGDLITNKQVTIEAYAPDGEMLGRQHYSYGSLKASLLSEISVDNSEPLDISVDPKIIVFNQESPVVNSHKKISGKVIDTSGENRAVGLQIFIMASEDASAEYGSDSFVPVFSAITNQDGYFYGDIDNKVHQQAYGVIAGLEDQPVTIPLVAKKFPSNIILLADLTALPDDLVTNTAVPTRPDASDLVNSSAFSQDLGGQCVDFTIPNRTLEEFSFYQTVRTTEPEIKGYTINSKQSQNLKRQFFDVSDNLFTLFTKMNNSFSTFSVTAYKVTESNSNNSQQAATLKSTVPTAEYASLSKIANITALPRYNLKLVAANNTHLKFDSNELLKFEKTMTFVDVVKIFAEQEKRRKKLKGLHDKLAAAFCGKQGVQEAQRYCDSVALKDELDRNTLRSLLGHIKQYKAFVKSIPKVVAPFSAFVMDINDVVQQEYVSADLLSLLEKKAQELVKLLDTATEESQDQEELLGYLRRLITELSRAQNTQLRYEPCPPTAKTDTMGIVCMMQEFTTIRETLRHKAVFSLDEIITIRSSYDIFINSITTFLSLLDEFYRFYRSSSRLLLALDDDYFVKHHSDIKDTLLSTKQQVYYAIRLIERIEFEYITNHPGRRNLSVETEVDWDSTPTVYENTTIAHGHILQFKQKWKADGYSLGDLLYSLPLAPCQEKQIAILDWDREERGQRSEEQVVAEQLTGRISRDRDITEIMNSSLNENMRASSNNSTSSTSAGIGGAIGGFFGVAFGVAGGVSHSGASSSSSATQNSSRHLSASALNRLQDNVSQSASSLRSQRNTVVQTVGQNETVMAQTEVVKNNNHCHAMTVEYFEVLKHYAIEQELVNVQECLFVPLPMSDFDHSKVLRWRNTLQRSIYGRKLRRGFSAIKRIENNYANSTLPLTTYSEENIEEFNGFFTISFELSRPPIADIDEATKTERYNLGISFPWFPILMLLPYSVERPLTEAEKDAIFEQKYAADIARKFIETLQIDALDDKGNEVILDLDFTLLSTYQRGRPMQVNVASKSLQNMNRQQIKHLRFRANTSVKNSSRIILRSVYLSYRTSHLNEYIVRNSRVNNDIINTTQLRIELGFPPIIRTEEKTDAALMYTPLNKQELRNPRKEDREAAEALVSFLNEHLEQSHKVIWSSMDSSRLFGLLDGYIAPNANGRSVASVVENKIAGIVGNNLVLKVVPGERLDPVFKRVEDLFSYYHPTTPSDPFRISVPTKGVYAESVMGKCNSCEEIDDTRHWRFNDEPCGSKPTAISTLSTDSRRADVGNLQPKDLPNNLISIQNTPTAPDPTGLNTAINAISKAGIFKDITGLEGTQQNAIKALQTTSKSVTDLATLAADIQKQQAMKKDIGKTLNVIKKAKKEAQITPDEAKELSYSALKSMVGVTAKKPEKLTEQKEIKQLIDAEATKKQAKIKISRDNESIEVEPVSPAVGTASFDYTVSGIVPIIAQPSSMSCWATVATMLKSWKDSASYTIETVVDAAGAEYRTMYDNDTGLPTAKTGDFATAMGFKTEPPMSYTVSGFRALIENFGPLIVIDDEDLSPNWALHARVVRGIYGDGTPDGTFIRINDPAGGRQYTESYIAFMQKYEQAGAIPMLQIMHY